MKTKSKEQLIHEAILNDKEIQRLQCKRYKIIESLPHTLLYNLDNFSFENVDNNNHPTVTQTNEQIMFRIKQIKKYYE